MIISLRAAPCRDESRDRASANRSPESFINGLVFTLKGLAWLLLNITEQAAGIILRYLLAAEPGPNL